MSIWKEFKEFALKGNVVDMAIGVVIGLSFGKIVSSFVADVIMPPLGLLIGGIDFSSMNVVLKHGATASQDVVIRYGVFINTVIDFLIIAGVIFLTIKGMKQLTDTHHEEAPTTKECPECCMSIPIKAKRCCHCSSNVSV